MAFINQENFRIRKSFAGIETLIDVPRLIKIQRESYDKFLQMNVPPEERRDQGLHGVFKSVFPIRDYNETASLEYVSYHFEPPKYEVQECRQRGMTYATPIKVVVRLVVWDVDEASGERNIRDVKEQEVYFGEIPLMTENGTFVINGIERVVVSQLHRSPGAFFDEDKTKSQATKKKLYTARIIPYRGSWLDFEFDSKDQVYVKIDRRRKLPVTILLRALGLSTEDIIDYFYRQETIYQEDDEYSKEIDFDLLVGQKIASDIADPADPKKILAKKGYQFSPPSINRLREAGITRLPVEEEQLIGAYVSRDVVDPATGEVIVECNRKITKDILKKIKAKGIGQFTIIYLNPLSHGAYIRSTLEIDKMSNREEPELESLVEIYRRLRPGEPPTEEAARTLFHSLFFNPERYDLSPVGRLKMNHKFGLDVPLSNATLTKDDILQVVRYLCELRDGRGLVDDIDHLGNRRVRPVGELLEAQYRTGLVRMERTIKERLAIHEPETIMPLDLINPKPVSAVVNEFFSSSQLAQFMDQTNPLSEITHKRRLSALGPGGLTRERAGFEVRDVHSTHYGRICPIETPEGPNIGLIVSLATYASVNEYGFIETPYRAVKDRVVQSDAEFYTAIDEGGKVIAQANAQLDARGRLATETVSCRLDSEFVRERAEKVQLMDVSPNQLVSVSSALIPFLEHDDANRALMGSNMQRQAVPLLKPKAPLIGTGIERRVASDSGMVVTARRDGVVDRVDAARIVVRCELPDDEEPIAVDIYDLVKNWRSNQSTCINQIPRVNPGDRVKKGDILADGPGTECGELALGQNVLVAFMPWGGYNFEDSILVSERVVHHDTFTSIHIEEFESAARDTKLGKEEITRDIPNAGEEALKDLDESGIIRIGAEVKAGDILVGKITPKGETQLSPEEKLLRAIFGEKASDVRDTSLRVPPGISGTVIDAQVFSRRGVAKDSRAKRIEAQQVDRLLKNQNDQIKIIRLSTLDQVRSLLAGQEVKAAFVDGKGRVVFDKGRKLDAAALADLSERELEAVQAGSKELQAKIKRIFKNLKNVTADIKANTEKRIEVLQKGDELGTGVIKIVKVYVAMKRKLSVGDKMAGRHGNKGVVSRILPIEDMPYLANGTPVDIVLNPLGVPSRMNVGQILEAHLGWAAKTLGEQLQAAVDNNFSPAALRKKLKEVYVSPEFGRALDGVADEAVVDFVRTLKDGVHMSSPVFNGAREEQIKKVFEVVDLPASGQATLFDGRTGDPFHREITIGVMYMVKLHHLVDDKIHARSIGPYSLVTQQPLGGKAQFGGQRLGEMEVWALEAYGASHTLQEFLTVKSDDIAGRNKMYEAIVKGERDHQYGTPESFNVLVKEMQSLGLNVELVGSRLPQPEGVEGEPPIAGGGPVEPPKA